MDEKQLKAKIEKYLDLQREMPLSWRAQLLHIEPFSSISCFQLANDGYLEHIGADNYVLTDKGKEARDLMVWWITREE